MDRSHLPTFPEVLDDWATNASERRAYLYLSDGEKEDTALNFAQLRNAVSAAARELSQLAQPGDRVILFYPSGLDFIVAFLGCLQAGIIAVPVSVPNRKRGLEIVAGIARDSGARYLLSVEALLNRYEADLAADDTLTTVTRIDTASWTQATSMQARGVEPSTDAPPARLVSPDMPALLQYTSGSTGAPRGVIVTHGNLSHNHLEQQRCLHHDENTVVVSWLPMFHDMGLGTILQALWVGGTCILMSPSAFLQKPVRWLNAISRYRGTLSGGPDFAFDLCTRSTTQAERDALDLRCWRVAFNGSEPVRSATLVRFNEVFARNGFRWEAFHPLFGLAEATLFVTGEELGRGPAVSRFSRLGLERRSVRADDSDNGQSLVGCGRTWMDGHVAIVDPETLEACPSDAIGEIWVGGPSVAAGYWGKPEETREIFQARTAAGEGPFLRTGDLGFQHAGNLYVTGRSKDLIIVRGSNHYPQDIEDLVSQCHPALEPQRCGAFSVESEDGESLVVVQEVKRTALRSVDPEDVFRAIRKAVADQHGLYASAIVLLRPLALPRTTSGKVRRKACRDGFLNGTLAAIASSGFVGATMDQPVRVTVPPPSSASPGATRLIQWLRQYSRASAPTELSRRSLTPEALAEFARQGLLGMQVGAEHGGLSLAHSETVRVLEQLGGVDLGASLFLGLNNYLGVWPILRHGQLHLQQDLLPQLASGQKLVSLALAEASEADGWHSRAEQVNGSGWRLFGRKFVTGGLPDSGLLNVFVRHEDRPGVSGFVVPRSAKGVSLANVHQDGMLRESVQMDGVFVDHAHVLGQIGAAEDIALDAIRHSNLAIGAACLGGMKRCSQLIFQHATQRQIGEAGLVAHPVTMTRLGRITAEVTALECLVRLLADLADEGQLVAAEAFTVCKLVGPEMLWQAVDDLVQLLGRRGLVETSQVRQLVDDARVLRGLEGPMEAGAALLGAGIFRGDLSSLRQLLSEVFGERELEPLVNQAVEALREGVRVGASRARSSSHWLDTRAGELTTWIILSGAVDLQRRKGPAAELERTAVWVRSMLDGVLAATRLGPPPEVRLGAEVIGGAIAQYERGPGDLAMAALRKSHAREGLREWAVSWLAERLRVPASGIDPRRSFADHGVDSLAAVEFAKALGDRVGVALDETLLWNFPTIDSLLSYLENPPAKQALTSASAPAGGAAPIEERDEPGEGTELEQELARLERELKKH